MSYADDRAFTNYVHTNLALPIIYNPLGWSELPVKEGGLDAVDMGGGVDYVMTNGKRVIPVQERFREKKYESYNDFTIRYRRDYNKHEERHESEYYKMTADFMVYGITNADKIPSQRANLTDFLKYVVVDLKVLYKLIDDEKIVFSERIRVSQISGGIMTAPINYNRDRSSSFVAFDVAQLNELFGDKKIILVQKGFLTNDNGGLRYVQGKQADQNARKGVGSIIR